MKKLRKAMALILVLSMCMSITACKKETETKDDTETGNQEENKSAGITILPVEGLSEDFVMGVDISSLIAEEESGAVYYDEDGNEADLFQILKDGGVNCVRIRVWNDPFDANGNSYGAGNCDIDNAIEIGKRATEYGMGVLIDFHYSDFWADPNKQTVPKAWEGMTLDEKITALSEYTTESVNKLLDAGVNVTMIQIGNEINNGMSGETAEANVCKLLKAGSDAIRAIDKNIEIVVHYTDPLSDGYLSWKASLLENAEVSYDILATSYYPFWHGDLEELTAVLKDVADTYGVKVMVAETSYVFTDEDGDGYGNVVSSMSSNQVFNYPISVEGQAIAVRDVIEAVSNVGEAGVGIFYWEPAWIPVDQEAWENHGSGWATSYAAEYDAEVSAGKHGGTWDNQAFFDFGGHVLESLNVFKYVYTGATGPLNVVRAETQFVEFQYGEDNELPKTVPVTYNDGTVVDVSVEWNEEEAKAVLENPDFGDFVVTGYLDDSVVSDYEVKCNVTVTASNYVVNGTFETGDETGWTVENESGAGWPKVDKNEANAKEGSHYYTAWAEDGFDFTISQDIQEELEEGTYKAFAYFQGTGVQNPSDIQFFVTVSGKGTSTEYVADVTIKNVWKEWYMAEISDIEINEDVDNVTIGAHIACTFEAGSTANGAWVVMDDVNFLKSK